MGKNKFLFSFFLLVFSLSTIAYSDEVVISDLTSDEVIKRADELIDHVNETQAVKDLETFLSESPGDFKVRQKLASVLVKIADSKFSVKSKREFYVQALVQCELGKINGNETEAATFETLYNDIEGKLSRVDSEASTSISSGTVFRERIRSNATSRSRGPVLDTRSNWARSHLGRFGYPRSWRSSMQNGVSHQLWFYKTIEFSYTVSTGCPPNRPYFRNFYQQWRNKKFRRGSFRGPKTGCSARAW